MSGNKMHSLPKNLHYQKPYKHTIWENKSLKQNIYSTQQAHVVVVFLAIGRGLSSDWNINSQQRADSDLAVAQPTIEFFLK